MILGMSPLLFVHVVLSLVGIVSGFIVVAGFLRSEQRAGWAAIFLLSTLATSLTGFPLPADRLLPSHIVGSFRSSCSRRRSPRSISFTSPAAGAGSM